jgi:hypothetical protein
MDAPIGWQVSKNELNLLINVFAKEFIKKAKNRINEFN